MRPGKSAMAGRKRCAPLSVRAARCSYQHRARKQLTIAHLAAGLTDSLTSRYERTTAWARRACQLAAGLTDSLTSRYERTTESRISSGRFSADP
eukprot:2723169-Prymnesium_polylepis.1